MKKILLIQVLLMLMLIGKAQSKDEKAIQRVVSDFETAFNQKNAKATAGFWAVDGDFVTYQGILLHGHLEIEKYFQSTFVQFYQTAKNQLFTPTVRFLKLDVAAVDVMWAVTERRDANDKALPTMKGIMVWTMTKEKGRWLIKIMHNVTLPEE